MNEAALFRDLSSAINPVKFAQSLGIDPDPWQRDLLLSNEKRIILNCSRQSGKSTICAILALHHALYNPGALVLIVSRSYRQSTELFKKVADFYQKRGRPIPSDAENKHTLELSNKSRIVSLPSKEQTIRGYSAPSLVIIDEAAQCADELYDALTPMLAVSKGRLILLSTPFGRSGFFFNVWSTGGRDWEQYKITAIQCPRISHDWLEEQKRNTSAWSFNQEYLCSFEANESSFFDSDEVKRALSDRVKAIRVRLNIKSEMA
jgi:hypothetical protein